MQSDFPDFAALRGAALARTAAIPVSDLEQNKITLLIDNLSNRGMAVLADPRRVPEAPPFQRANSQRRLRTPDSRTVGGQNTV